MTLPPDRPATDTKAKICQVVIRHRKVKCPYGPPGMTTIQASAYCAACGDFLGGQVKSANAAGHRYAQAMVERAWQEHLQAKQGATS